MLLKACHVVVAIKCGLIKSSFFKNWKTKLSYDSLNAGKQKWLLHWADVCGDGMHELRLQSIFMGGFWP